jgi:hypothetical protein
MKKFVLSALVFVVVAQGLTNCLVFLQTRRLVPIAALNFDQANKVDPSSLLYIINANRISLLTSTFFFPLRIGVQEKSDYSQHKGEQILVGLWKIQPEQKDLRDLVIQQVGDLFVVTTSFVVKDFLKNDNTFDFELFRTQLSLVYPQIYEISRAQMD